MEIKMINYAFIFCINIESDNILFCYLLFILGLFFFSNEVLSDIGLLKLVSY